MKYKEYIQKLSKKRKNMNSSNLMSTSLTQSPTWCGGGWGGGAFGSRYPKVANPFIPLSKRSKGLPQTGGLTNKTHIQ